MGLTPKKPQENPNYDWDFLDLHLKTHLKVPGSSVGINPSFFIMDNDEMLNELIKNGYSVNNSDPNRWEIS
ncbi:hypothetical protein MXM24_14585 [Enterococcus gallinarum]|mgnify:CR=1 FL=1|uniref:Uncharacterized protein n=1 Tax=Siphoviridae sp. ct1is2 TaxID=2826273 RepID=A0A8S5NNP4_9CAUD|nr:hypothetical protein [Enterococcus gallinarum]MCC4043744.1 hypothetical protein [Enterococcus gallinarum]MEB6065006.1 hypothetical protein [Enterococcus gallinarum]DAD95848.1 MAG TPA: hypothetical protein [Siphoviridae sp. ct1is2]